jgi:hypothetical protein
MRRVAVCALMLLLASACSSGPTLDDAARVMAKDGAEVVATQYMENKQVTDKTGTDGDDPIGCPHDTARRSYQVTGDFGEAKNHTPAELADLAGPPLRIALRGLGYEADASATTANASGRSIGVLRKKDPGITFTVIVRSAPPNVEIIGKTDCLPTK